MTQRNYSDCRSVPPDPGCGTCDVCVVTAAAERADGDGVLTIEQTARLLTHLAAELH